MARSISVQTEIIWGRHQSLAKVMLPKSIHQNTGGQGIVGAGEPAGQIEAIQTGILLRRRRRGFDVLVLPFMAGLRRLSPGHSIGPGHPVRAFHKNTMDCGLGLNSLSLCRADLGTGSSSG